MLACYGCTKSQFAWSTSKLPFGVPLKRDRFDRWHAKISGNFQIWGRFVKVEAAKLFSVAESGMFLGRY